MEGPGSDSRRGGRFGLALACSCLRPCCCPSPPHARKRTTSMNIAQKQHFLRHFPNSSNGHLRLFFLSRPHCASAFSGTSLSERPSRRSQEALLSAAEQSKFA